MQFSEQFGIVRTSADDWFDPILDADTRLFVDPFLVFKDQDPRWRDSYRALIQHFERAFRLIAEGDRKPTSLPYSKALRLLLFKEPKEFCLGFTGEGTDGLGSGARFAKAIGLAISEAITRGLVNPRHFEELGILNKGIGRDRISDITCTVLKRYLITYTQEIATRHGVAMSLHGVYASSFDDQRLQWNDLPVELPTNPATGGPILLVPERFLRELPTLNADDWWDDYEAQHLRDDVNYHIMGNVSKDDIIAAARANPEAVRRWAEKKEASDPRPYDLGKDRLGVWQWHHATAAFTAANPLVLRPPQSEAEFFAVIDLVCEQFRLFVEDQGGWKLLWDLDNSKAKPEEAAQILFYGMTRSYCHANNVVLDREVDLGRGPVDFKFSNGYSRRAHLEVKKLDNGKFWNGLERQLPSYMKSDSLRDGWFLTVQQTEAKPMLKRLRAIPGRVHALNEQGDLNIRCPIVNAMPKRSASKL